MDRTLGRSTVARISEELLHTCVLRFLRSPFNQLLDKSRSPLCNGRRICNAVRCKAALPLKSIDTNSIRVPFSKASSYTRFLSSNPKQCLHRGVVTIGHHQSNEFIQLKSMLPWPTTTHIAIP
jgi:hypothetical protein